MVRLDRKAQKLARAETPNNSTAGHKLTFRHDSRFERTVGAYAGDDCVGYVAADEANDLATHFGLRPSSEAERDHTIECLDKFGQEAEKAAAHLTRLIEIARAAAAHLRSGKPAGRVGIVGVSDLAARVNTLSRWEGRILDSIDRAYEMEQGE